MNFFKTLITSFIGSLFLFPVYVFAHGTEADHQKEMMIDSYVLLGSGILFTFLFICYLLTNNKVKSLGNVKNQEHREQRHQLTKTTQKLKWAWILSLVVVLISGGMSLFGNGASGVSEINLKHVHGLGYSNDGKKIYIPSHDGLAVYSFGKWDFSEGEKHDYMGFSVVDNGFYSSGHPAEKSDMANPFGIVKSTDEGKTLEILDLYGKIDFHTMGASYKTHTIYVMNPTPNARMDSTGLYYTKDETKTWIKSEMNGILDDSLHSHNTWISLAVHPTDDSVIAIGTPSGVYLSGDYGNNFDKVLVDTQATSLSFNDEGALLVGGFSTKPVLLMLDIESKETEEINIPTLKEDAINYIAQNPVNNNEWVVTTFKKDVYLFADQGENWAKIADKGKSISQSNH
jgi:hypothetical protein